MRPEFAKRLENLGVAALLLTAITVCIAQGYKGYQTLQNEGSMAVALEPLPGPVEASPEPRPAPEAVAKAHRASPMVVHAIKASARVSREHGKRETAHNAVWRQQPAAYPAQAPHLPPRAAYPNRFLTTGWPGVQRAAPARMQRPVATPRTLVRPAAVRSGFGSRMGGKSSMGFG